MIFGKMLRKWRRTENLKISIFQNERKTGSFTTCCNGEDKNEQTQREKKVLKLRLIRNYRDEIMIITEI